MAGVGPGVSLRTRQLPVSAMYRVPAGSRARPVGFWSCAALGPTGGSELLSPLYPQLDGTPATTLRVPWLSSSRTEQSPWPLTNRSPEPSRASPIGATTPAVDGMVVTMVP